MAEADGARDTTQIVMTETIPILPSVYKEGEVTNGRGHKLFTGTYLPVSGDPRGIVLWHHGLSEHISRYTHVFPALAAAGVAVYTYDVHGQGKSEPATADLRSYVDNYEHLLDDYHLILKGIKDDYTADSKPLPPIIAGGQSLGGLIAALAVARDPAQYAGLAMQSPLIDIEWTPFLRMQAKMGSWLAFWFPKAALVPAVRPEDMSQDPKVVKEYMEDPLNYVGKVKCKTAHESLKAMAELQKLIPKLTVPIYLAHGTSDKCTIASASKKLLDAAPSTDKVFNSVEGGYHELLFGPEKKEVIASLVKWLVAHTGPAAAIPAAASAATSAVPTLAAAAAAAIPAASAAATEAAAAIPAAAAAVTDAAAAVPAAAAGAADAAAAAIPAATGAVTDAVASAPTAPSTTAPA